MNGVLGLVYTLNLIQTNLIQIKFDDKSTSDLDDEINKTNLIFCRAFRIYLTSDEFKKKCMKQAD